ncbi:MAG: hypothetical protein PHH85_10115 [Candidatus Methanoperedens sp.]|nr:hypothetical protein [Candidatus Methanoperedens sp.]
MNNTVNKKVVLLVTTLSSFLAPFMGSSIFIGLPTIGKEFSMDVTPEYYPVFLRSVNAAFMVFAAFCFIGIFASLARGKIR